MATNPQRAGSQRSGWPGKGKSMTEDAYHELEHLSPDRKYEFIDGIAYMMSGGSVAHDRINRNIGNALDRQIGSDPFTVFGVDVQVLIGTKKMESPTMCTQMRRFPVSVPIDGQTIRSSHHRVW